MRIAGICRFSYLATRGWKRTVAEDTEATAAALYAPERMVERFRIFEALCLPSILAQTDPDFDFILIVSFAMPQEWRARLDALVAPHDRLHVVTLKPRPMTEAVTVALRRTLGRGQPEPVVQFCLDDDDALSIHYVARLRAEASGVLASPMGERLPVAINQPRGITLGNQDGCFEARETFAPFLALGLALITDGRIPTNVYVCPHLKTPTRILSMADPKPMTYLRGIHDHHDSQGILKGRTLLLEPERFRRHLENEFPFTNEAALEAVFGPQLEEA